VTSCSLSSQSGKSSITLNWLTMLVFPHCSLL